MSNNRNILVIRNDKLGDFMLSWPALSTLKQQYPEAIITVLVPAYTRPMAEICPWIDHCITDEHHQSLFSDVVQLKKKFKAGKFDTVITLYSEFRIGLALWLSGITTRVAPATKIAQIFYNKKLVQRRSKSEKPEYEYNTDLVRFFVRQNGDEDVEPARPPYLAFDSQKIKSVREKFLQENSIGADKKLIFIHPGTGGSAINLSTEQFYQIASKLLQSLNAHIVITAGPDELQSANNLAERIPEEQRTIYHSTSGIVNFSKFLAISDIFISGSTGPLHIAGALDRPTAAFYPARRSATPLRWQTLNQQDRRLVFTPEKHIDENDMQTIDPLDCAEVIAEFLMQK